MSKISIVSRFVILAPTQRAGQAALEELGVSPLPFMRGDGLFLVSDTEISTIKGIGPAAWSVIPRYTVDETVERIVESYLRTPQMRFHEMIARRLAWRLYHEQ